MKDYIVLGMMSGTSIDGLDIVLCKFSKQSDGWTYRIERSKTFSYSSEWKTRLDSADRLSGLELTILDLEYGAFLSEMICDFLSEHPVELDFIASHGHTIFHQPENLLTLQIGNGAVVASHTGSNVISDFRTADVALGGQGAPLVPVGDDLLFSDYDYCINLGGIGNISFRSGDSRIAFDICPVNMAINTLIRKIKLDFDRDGEYGRSGKILPDLLAKLNAIEFYKLQGPRSLGKEWFEESFIPLIREQEESLNDLLRTVYEHIAIQICQVIENSEQSTVLVTGGGAHNRFLIERFRCHSQAQFIIPDKELIDYKEALVFAFLGLLRWRGEINCYASVTGASRDSITGTIYAGKIQQ
jgi:anhydro-N-acetylmuramic acid kinase